MELDKQLLSVSLPLCQIDVTGGRTLSLIVAWYVHDMRIVFIQYHYDPMNLFSLASS